MSTSSTVVRLESRLGESDVFNAFERIFAASPCVSIPLRIPTSTITVRSAREILSNRQSPRHLCDTIWSATVHRSQQQQDPWQTVALWLMLPSLRAISRRLCRTWHLDIEDARSEVLLSFLKVLRSADPNRARIGSYLWWRTFGAARQACMSASREHATEDIELIASTRPDPRHDWPSAIPNTPEEAPSDPGVREGERLGALAGRLGIRHVVTSRGNGNGVAA